MCTKYQELSKIKSQIATELQNGFVEKKYSVDTDGGMFVMQQMIFYLKPHGM